MQLYTIGFTQKTAKEFFELLLRNNVQRLIDIRINPSGQLSGFAKKDDLPYLLYYLSEGCEYVHMPQLAPTKEILKDYHTDKNWARYVDRFETLMDQRSIPLLLKRSDFETPSCLLCSEATPEQCHRRLVAERIALAWKNVEIIHL